MALSSPARSIPWTPQGIAWSIHAAVEAHHKEVGARLKSLRDAKEWSQEDAAQAVDVGVKTWGDWERGRRWPYEANWNRIAEVFDVDKSEIKGTPPSPLGLGISSADPTQLDRIEAKIDTLLKRTDG